MKEVEERRDEEGGGGKVSMEFPLHAHSHPMYTLCMLTHAHTQDPDEGSIYYHPVYFTFQDEKQKPCAVRALYDYNAMRNDELSFCKDAIITNVDKHDGGWWRGDYGRRKKRWFPANYVEEIDTNDPASEERQLGNIQQGAIDIAGCKVEMHNIPGNNMYMLRIYPKTSAENIGRPALEVAADSPEEILEWQEVIEEQRNKAETQKKEMLKIEQVMKQHERVKRIARELSDMVVYCRPVPFAFERE